MGLEFLKAANGWTDEEMYNRFRERMARHMQETGENLLEQAFELQAFSLKTGQRRMDSTLLASNIRQMGRVQRLVTVLQRVWRMLAEEDPLRYADLFAPYLKGHAGQYVSRLKKDDLPVHLQRIGEEMRRLLTEREAAYGGQPADPVLARVFTEHFRLEPEGLQVKEARELSAGSLQSPDDLEAIDREKRGQGHRGYGANLTETCDPENPVQWITKVPVAPNTPDDTLWLAEALPGLKAHTGVEALLTDSGFGSLGNDALWAEQQVTLVQTAIRGRRRDPERFYLDDFQVQADASGTPEQVTGPMSESAAVTLFWSGKAFLAVFVGEACACCAGRARCPVVGRQRSGDGVLRFTAEEMWRAERRRPARRRQSAGQNRQAAVESTVRSVQHPFAGGKLPVRGCFRVACMVIGSAAVTNVRGLHRFLRAGFWPLRM